MQQFIDNLSWGAVIIIVLTLGLAPYKPPHFFEKLQMLFRGTLVRPIDWFDFVMHGSAWAILVLKIAYSLKAGK
jgi:hypothetical protein